MSSILSLIIQTRQTTKRFKENVYLYGKKVTGMMMTVKSIFRLRFGFIENSYHICIYIHIDTDTVSQKQTNTHKDTFIKSMFVREIKKKLLQIFEFCGDIKMTAAIE